MGEKTNSVSHARGSTSSGIPLAETTQPLEHIRDETVAIKASDHNKYEVRAGEADEPNDGEETEDIRADIEHTRAEMSGTIDAIQKKLSPQRLIDDAKDTVRDATVGKVNDMMNTATESVGTLVDTIRENPIPAALVGFGAWWLFGRKHSNERHLEPAMSTNAAPGSRWRGRNEGSGGLVETLKQYPVPAMLAGLSAGWWFLDRQRQASSSHGWEYADTLYAERPSEYRGSGKGVREFGEVASETSTVVKDVAARTQQRLGDTTRRAHTEFDRLLRDSPLALGAVALAAGAAIGLAVPESESENRLMGEARDQVVEKVQDYAQDLAGKVQQVTTELQEEGDEPEN